MWDVKYWHVVYSTASSTSRSQLFFPFRLSVSTCLQQDSALVCCADSLLHSSTGQTRAPAPQSCIPRMLRRLNLSQPVLVCNYTQRSTRQDTPRESHLIGREGCEKKMLMKPVWLTLEPKNVFINLHAHLNDNAHPMPAKHDAHVYTHRAFLP